MKHCYMRDAQTSSSIIAPATDFGAVMVGIRPRGFGVTPYTWSRPTLGRITYYVATTGSDTHAGTSVAPFRTINKAAQVAVAGDVVTIRNGTYQESIVVRNSGASDKPIVFQAENRGGVLLTGGRYTFQPAAWFGGKRSTGGQFYITVKGLIFRDYADPHSADCTPRRRSVRGSGGGSKTACSTGRDGLG